jgi:hypothetical protein
MDIGRRKELAVDRDFDVGILTDADFQWEPVWCDLVLGKLQEAHRASIGVSSPDDAQPLDDVELRPVGPHVPFDPV